MKRQVNYYHGAEITLDVIKRINEIERKRINEGITCIISEPISSVGELCDIHLVSSIEQEHIILGEDWYIMYSILENQIELNEWLAVNNVDNKLIQTMEMYQSLKKLLLQSKDYKFFATMRHSTSYRFYQNMLNRGFLQEISNRAYIDENLPYDLELIKNDLKSKYSTLEEYLQNEDKEQLTETDFSDFIYHLVIFKTTKSFTKKYKK